MRYLLIAVLVVLAVVIARIPARPIIEQLPPGTAELAQPAGTLWRGSARLIVDGRPLGVLSWSVDPLALLRLTLEADIALSGPELVLTGAGGIGFDQRFDTQLQGEIGNPLLNTILAPYAIRIDGDLAVRALQLNGELIGTAASAGALEDVIAFSSLSGQLNWEGGLASYTLQGGTRTLPLPELEGNLELNGEQLPELTVRSPGVDHDLLRASVLPEGFVKVGVSRRFTAMAGMPWPSQGPDDEIVLEVEQQVF